MSYAAKHHAAVRGGHPSFTLNPSQLNPNAPLGGSKKAASPESEIVTMRLKFAGICLKAKHRALDSKLSLVLRDLDIEDVILSGLSGGSEAGESLLIYI